MSENTPNPPPGALPPKPAEAAKVQPKKETVRINLPPKPTSAPTIKLPTLAPGGPPPSIGAAAPAAVQPPSPPRAAAPAAPAAPVSAAAKPGSAPTVQRAPAAPAPSAPRPAAPVAAGISGLDKGLAIAAAVVSLAAVGSAVYLAFFLKDASGN